MNSSQDDLAVRDAVRRGYAEIARSDSSAKALPAAGCCGGSTASLSSLRVGYEAAELASVPTTSDLGLGCGNPTALAELRPGEVVVDLGSGAGLDCFLAAQKVGSAGRVIGVDMTPEMISKARSAARSVGSTNVEFRLGEIEHLPIADSVADVVISNCVINLSPEKSLVFFEAFRVLKPGGRLEVSDIVATRPIPEEAKADLSLVVSCVAGAASGPDLERWIADAGFQDISLEINEQSRQFIQDWSPDRGVDRFVASARIRARKPDLKAS